MIRQRLEAHTAFIFFFFLARQITLTEDPNLIGSAIYRAIGIKKIADVACRWRVKKWGFICLYRHERRSIDKVRFPTLNFLNSSIYSSPWVYLPYGVRHDSVIFGLFWGPLGLNVDLKADFSEKCVFFRYSTASPHALFAKIGLQVYVGIKGLYRDRNRPNRDAFHKLYTFNGQKVVELKKFREGTKRP